MHPVDRSLCVLRQQPVDRPPVIGVTSVVTVELMRRMGIRSPDAHHDPEQMVRAGAAAHEVCGLESVKVPFDMTVEAGALGADVDYGSDTVLPRLRGHLFTRPEEFVVPEDFPSRGRVPVVLEAIRIARQRHGGAAPIISPAQYAAHVAPLHRVLCRSTELPLIAHICGDITRHLPHLAEVGFCGISFDAKTDIRAARTHLKGRCALIGYVPTSLLREGSPEQVQGAVRHCVQEGVDAINAGCAVPPDTPLDNIRAMIAAGKGSA